MTNHPNRSKRNEHVAEPFRSIVNAIGSDMTQTATTDDHVMRGYLDSQKKRRGWKTSGHTYNPTPVEAQKSVGEFVAWMLANGGKRAGT